MHQAIMAEYRIGSWQEVASNVSSANETIQLPAQ
jgi:hypothetical protein